MLCWIDLVLTLKLVILNQSIIFVELGFVFFLSTLLTAFVLCKLPVYYLLLILFFYRLWFIFRVGSQLSIINPLFQILMLHHHMVVYITLPLNSLLLLFIQKLFNRRNRIGLFLQIKL